MLKNSLKVFKELIFKEHKYDYNSDEIKILKKISNLSKYKNIYFSMNYNNIYKNLLYELKYRKCIYVSNLIADIIKKDVEKILDLENIDYILISPISKKRLQNRGFNQVYEIVKRLELDIEILEIKKIRETSKMSKFKEEYNRKVNVLKSFDVKKLYLDNKKVLIFDDVITTGATINSISNELKKEYINIEIVIYGIAISKKIFKI